MSLLAFVLPVLAYLMGSVSTAVIVSRALGLPDPRATGSRNPGATNVLRIGGKKAAIITLLGDLLKGVLPVVLARGLGAGPVVLAIVAVCAFIGHLYPVFFGFRGGKGVATALGVLLAISPLAGLALLGIWLLVAGIFRYSSLAAVTAAIAAPFVVLLAVAGNRLPYGLAALTMSVLLLWRHRSNIRNLRNGSESKIGAKAGPAR
ncbi:MAG: glycerol-3-phosphate 1-O-acyltransferase PlsY [Gammaproteobacteria bacterium]|nr:glycerol-3-phosphate 1-O-acyltransferase PlsY [Gammaproteobacteria bacterium]